jgi:hypothetical protein
MPAGPLGRLQEAVGRYSVKGQAPMRVTLQGDVLARAGGWRRYEVRAITAGNGNGLRYSDAVLGAAMPLFEGVSVLVDHGQLSELFSLTGGRSVRNVLGVLEHVFYADGGVCGELRVYPGPDAEWFTAMVDQHLIDRSEGRASPRIGLSAVLDVLARGGEVVSIAKVVSVDAVFDPARGGEFIRALNQKEVDMPEVGVVGDPAAAAPVVPAAPLQAAPAVPAQPAVSANVPVQPVPADRSPVVADAVAAGLSQQVLDLRLAGLQLPDGLKGLLRQRYGGVVYQPADLQRDVEALQSAWAASVAAAGQPVRGVPAVSSVSGVINEADRAQALMDQLCGLRPKSEALQGMRPVSGIRELYLLLTGDYDFRGGVDPQRVGLAVTAEVTCANLPSLVKNAFNKVILDYFNTVDRWWESISAPETFGSMKDVTLITLGGFADLATVAEGDVYLEKAWSDSEEVASFVKKGAYVGITLEMMDKDETRAFRAIPRKLAIAGYRTLSADVSALFTANTGVGPYWPSSQATYRLFDAQYANLGTTALSPSSWDAVIQAMFKQAEATSAKRMGIRPSYIMVPIELEKTALTILDSIGEPGTADNDANVRRASSRVVVVPEWTDTDNWAAVADPRVWPGIMIGYRFGAVPEVFVAGEETIGSMFTHDEMQVKVRFIYALGVGDNRPLYKQNVT